MANLVNDSFNLLPAQCSSNNTSRYFYTSNFRGTQTDFTFHDAHAAFTADMVGGLLQFASNENDKSYSFAAMVTSVDSPTTLTLSISQNISDSEYILWYDGVQFDQTGTLSVENLIVNGTSFLPSSFNVQAELLTATSLQTYSPGQNVKYMTVEGVGAGGAGGSAADFAVAAGGSGGAGAYFKITVPATAFTYQCGTGGTAVANSAGNAGGATVINGLGSTITAGGGAGGAVANNTVGSALALGGNGGTPPVVPNVLGVSGQAGGYGLANTNIECVLMGAGGSSLMGAGGKSTAVNGVNGSLPGLAASLYGSGGAGAGRLGTGTVTNGGAGSSGAILVTTYSL